MLCLASRNLFDLHEVADLEQHPANRRIVVLDQRLLVPAEAERFHRGTVIRRTAGKAAHLRDTQLATRLRARRLLRSRGLLRGRRLLRDGGLLRGGLLRSRLLRSRLLLAGLLLAGLLRRRLLLGGLSHDRPPAPPARRRAPARRAPTSPAPTGHSSSRAPRSPGCCCPGSS